MKLVYATVAAIVFAVVTACTTTGPTTPAQTIYEIESGYATALAIAVAYKQLPPCGAGAPVICSQAAVVAKLQQADDVAYPALQAAQNTVRTAGAGANAQTAIVAAQQAVQALTAITATLQVKP